MFVALAAAAVVAGAAWVLYGSSLLAVRSVAVTGAPASARAAVLREADVTPGTPLIRVNTAAVAVRVEQLTQVQSAQVSRHWPDSVVIAVTERTPALAVPALGGFALVDRFGVVIGQVPRLPRGMVLLAGQPVPASLRGSPLVGLAATVLRQLPPQLRALVSAVSVTPSGGVTLHVRGRITVVWGGTDRPAAKAAELAILMRTKASFYDVSAPGSAVTRG